LVAAVDHEEGLESEVAIELRWACMQNISGSTGYNEWNLI
jgi:hypothetical protein